MKNKNVLLWLSVCCLALGLTACGGKTGKTTAAEAGAAPTGTAAAQSREAMPSGSARPELSQFSNKFLAQKFYQDPMGLVTALNTGGQSKLHDLWQENSKAMGMARTPDSSGLALESRQLKNGGGAVLISLPAPQRNGDAYFAAMVLAIRKTYKGGMEGEANYYVLEQSAANNARLYLIEGDQRKLRAGDIRPDIDGLWDAVRHQVRQ